MELNQRHLEDVIDNLEKGYVTSKVELIKLPIFLKQIKKELRKKTLDDAKRKQLEWMIDNNKIQAKWHIESMENIEQILTEVYKLRT